MTLITRPRRFGKTLNMGMLEYFFPWTMPGRENCSRVFSVWKDEEYKAIQGT